MKSVFTTKRICRAGVIAALYVALTYAFSPFAFGPLQIRPAEALCILPLFFPEAVPALYIGCVISNLASPYLLYDIAIGSTATLLAALCTYFIGRKLKNEGVKLFVGGIFPVLFNTLMIPMIIVFLCGDLGGYDTAWTAYFVFALSFLLTESVWVYGLGIPLYYGVKKTATRRF